VRHVGQLPDQPREELLVRLQAGELPPRGRDLAIRGRQPRLESPERSAKRPLAAEEHDDSRRSEEDEHG